MKKGINKQRPGRRLRRVPLWLTFAAYGGCGEDDKLGWPVVLPGRAPWAGLWGQRGTSGHPPCRDPSQPSASLQTLTGSAMGALALGVVTVVGCAHPEILLERRGVNLWG